MAGQRSREVGAAGQGRGANIATAQEMRPLL
jgi:hypothetical protein